MQPSARDKTSPSTAPLIALISCASWHGTFIEAACAIIGIDVSPARTRPATRTAISTREGEGRPSEVCITWLGVWDSPLTLFIVIRPFCPDLFHCQIQPISELY